MRFTQSAGNTAAGAKITDENSKFMHLDNRPPLEERVSRAAEAALAHHQYASSIDVLTGIGWLAPSHVDLWRKGRIDQLEPRIQGNHRRIPIALAAFNRWAEAKGLRAMEAAYSRTARDGLRELQFSASGDPRIEKSYRTHYVSPELSERKREQLAGRLEKAPQPVVFQILRESQCSECGTQLGLDDFLLMDAGQPLCLPCAGLGELEFLPSGDTALTRRSGKYSQRSAVVVRFSRSRGRYERQGILVEPAALGKAEQECLDDADARERERQRGAERRSRGDQGLVARMAAEIRTMLPGCPLEEARAIAAHTAVRGSGRVGRSAAGRNLNEDALTLAVAAAIRHRHTDYDELLAGGLDRGAARSRVNGRVRGILESWRVPGEEGRPTVK
jgi:hypothetical protein